MCIYEKNKNIYDDFGQLDTVAKLTFHMILFLIKTTTKLNWLESIGVNMFIELVMS